jgi:YjbE family integral membrane protein
VRAIALIAAGFLLLIPGLKIIAGAFLLYVGYQLLNDHDNEDNIESPEGMMAAVKTIIIADLMMSIDNVMAVAGAAQSAGALAIYYSIAGILFSIPIIVLGAKYLTTLMDKFPIIIWLGAGLLGWVGAEMVISDSFVIEHVKNTEWLYKIAGFFAVILAVVASKHFNKTESNV